MPSRKEPWFFLAGREDECANPFFFSERVSDPRQYVALFAGLDGERAVGEASTAYLQSPVAAQRIRRNVPEARIVALLRDPVERAHSHYWFARSLGNEPAPTFELALAREETQGKAGPGLRHRQIGLYFQHLTRYFELFPRDQIKVCLYEDWRQSPHALLSDLYGFLDVASDFVPAVRERNVTVTPRVSRLHHLAIRSGNPRIRALDRRLNVPARARPAMNAETRARLRESYRGDIERLQELIDRDLGPWMA
jgi:hypothetical protein